jgi:hypothetical protein
LTFSNAESLASQAEASRDPFAWLYLSGCYLVGSNQPFKVQFPNATENASPAPANLAGDRQSQYQLKRVIRSVARKSHNTADQSGLVCVCERVHAIISIPPEDCVYESAFQDKDFGGIHGDFYLRQSGTRRWTDPFETWTYVLDRVHSSKVIGVNANVLSSRLLKLPKLTIAVKRRPGTKSDPARPSSVSATLRVADKVLQRWSRRVDSLRKEDHYDAYETADQVLQRASALAAQDGDWNAQRAIDILNQALDSVKNEKFYAQFHSLLEGMRQVHFIDRTTFRRNLDSIRAALWDSIAFGRTARQWLQDWISSPRRLTKSLEEASLGRTSAEGIFRASRPESQLSTGELFWPTSVCIESKDEHYCRVRIQGRKSGTPVRIPSEKLASWGINASAGACFLAEVNLNADHPSRLRFRAVQPMDRPLVSEDTSQQSVGETIRH